MSYFKFTKIQRVSFWNNFFRQVGIWKKVYFEKNLFWLILFRDNDIFLIFPCFFKNHDFESKDLERVRFEFKVCPRVRSWFVIIETCHILNWKFVVMSEYELKFLQRVRFWIKFFLGFLIVISNLHVFFTAFFSKKLRTNTAYIIFVNLIATFAAVQTTFVVLLFAKCWLFVLAMGSHFFPVWDWYMQKIAATAEINDWETLIAFASDMSD